MLCNDDCTEITPELCAGLKRHQAAGKATSQQKMTTAIRDPLSYGGYLYGSVAVLTGFST